MKVFRLEGSAYLLTAEKLLDLKITRVGSKCQVMQPKSFSKSCSPSGGQGRERVEEEHSAKTQSPAGFLEGVKLATHKEGEPRYQGGPHSFKVIRTFYNMLTSFRPSPS